MVCGLETSFHSVPVRKLITVVTYALTVYQPSCHQVPYFITCIPYLLAKVLAHFIGSYLGGEGGRKWIYGIDYQVGTMVTQLWFIHNEVIWGLQWIGAGGFAITQSHLVLGACHMGVSYGL
jgi:hypothetical protein